MRGGGEGVGGSCGGRLWKKRGNSLPEANGGRPLCQRKPKDFKRIIARNRKPRTDLHSATTESGLIKSTEIVNIYRRDTEGAKPVPFRPEASSRRAVKREI